MREYRRHRRNVNESELVKEPHHKVPYVEGEATYNSIFPFLTLGTPGSTEYSLKTTGPKNAVDRKVGGPNKLPCQDRWIPRGVSFQRPRHRLIAVASLLGRLSRNRSIPVWFTRYPRTALSDRWRSLALRH
ncbi:hypothetical protein TNCV_1917031 [Trichonephila clavipes]|uniref:Uncharacterized protein n=1 Tax=Trichonephila clavipes TaxID=2585209 RepID=A0A8X7BBS3_TRICX|nr:hypothetical protein TNCV_1917031 [Trichonephila clavipes]